MKKYLSIFFVVLFLFSTTFAFKVTMVTDVGGLGDKSFNDGTWQGVLRARDELGVEIAVIQSSEQTDYLPNLSNAARDSDVVIAVGFMMTDVLFNVAPQFPDTYFVGIDIEPSPGQIIPSNVVCYVFNEHESSFPAGYLAAMMSKTGKVGFIGGVPVPAVTKFEAGFKAGVKVYNELHNENIQVISGYANTFNEPALGKNLALTQMENGADIVFHAAGPTGNGVIDAAKEKGSNLYNLPPNAPLEQIIDKYYELDKNFYAIGVDVDQDHMAPGYVLTSAMKRVDTAAFEGIQSAMSVRTFESGVFRLGMKEDGVSITPMKYTRSMVPIRYFVEIEYLKKLIKEGKLKIPSDPSKIGSFEVPEITFPY
ncbi:MULTISPECIES: BMP family lipoprotein [Petrotoga]|uniref:Nucleoside-binding protein n=4 Tax=Petrotoga TaxID=28236 RepID=A0A4R8EGC9_9BACT|nr:MULTISPECIES: BMP family ABC transporter substrate-binding protein [Petrotoga]PNR95697.1 membrane protein [Petrotoga olearia DSM 13574]POZ87843.1 membrane protein [Petrotoga sibirica DSM 13575]RMA71329.1 nucleoside-binding protein [Petrotoga olearia]TDX10914.1 nucleoside-binding protein [Petrotoga sibirica]